MSLSEKPGLVVSSAAHVALLAATLLSLSRTPKFQDAQETIPVEIVSASDVNQIMHGDKTAKQVQPKQRADKIADTTEIKPKPPLAEAKRDVPTPPSPDKKLADPGEADKAPPKPQQAAVLPPPPEAGEARSRQARPAKPDVKPPPEQADASEPLPVPRPKIDPPKKAEKTEEAKKPSRNSSWIRSPNCSTDKKLKVPAETGQAEVGR